MSYSADTRNQVVQAYSDHPTYNCSKCSAVIALKDETITKLFQGRDGRGLQDLLMIPDGSLMHSAVNLKLGSHEDRSLITGVHTVADAFCMGCNERIGWFYHKASDFSQKYKEGKYLLEREKLVKENAWKLDTS
ncbi:yippee-domain-containing protein [Mycena capillaripes]|nr:yippee-domain-containing protein [Mycena capillaripes]